MHYSKIGNDGAGLTNQIFALITSIIIAFSEKQKVIIVDHFLNDINTKTYSPIKDILNLVDINIFLKKTYDIIIVDKYNIDFEILSVKYGINDTNYLDLTDFIKNKYYKENKLVIHNNYCLNDIKGDPCPGKIKHLILKYKINNNIIEEIYHEHNKNINIHFDGPYLFSFGYVNLFKNDMFNKILPNILFNNDFIIKSDIIKKQMNINKKINIIHLRLEDDGILHWSNQNNITAIDYKSYLEEKYIHLIRTYISDVDETILLSSSLSNKVIDFLNVHNYNYKFIDKCFKDREKNAIIDLLLSSCCNNIFIGNFNINNNNGSVFSYYISKCIKNKITTICIDLDRIYNKEIVIY
jgi:hypothetical protein